MQDHAQQLEELGVQKKDPDHAAATLPKHETRQEVLDREAVRPRAVHS